ncbi:hypothetical protein C900_01762 [Fulvivirga imtechensis AK7]|uniref:CHAT domain-containing protein n=1 Tax=Fulvivirga imtechensis AK7 TaxID=1237149 RepID=L8JVJ1_9BACT|nr:CHAT domain-containing protein [Fulvivirga imtechensis]ELR72208.1 hypothetical protein C900_01762 [Fulvivirga imtechensis AK7]
MKCVFFLLLVLFTFTTTSHSQKKYITEIDSLNKVLAVSSGVERLEILDQLIERYFANSENEKMYELLAEMDTLAHQLNDGQGILRAYYYQGLIAFHKEWKADQAKEYFHKALKYGKKNKIESPLTYSGLYNNLGLVYKNIEQYDSAIYYYERTAAINEAHQLDKRNVSLFLNLGRIYRTVGQFHLHLTYAQKCLDVAIKVEDETAICTGYRAISEALHYDGSSDLAREYCRKALDLSIKLYGENHSNTALIKNWLSKCYSSMGDYEAALYYARGSCYSLRQVYGDLHPKLGNAYVVLAGIHMETATYDSAEYYYLKAYDCAVMAQVEKNVIIGMSARNVAKFYLSVGKFSEARKYLNLAFAKGLNFGNKAETNILNGDLYVREGDYLKALEAYNHALSARFGIFNFQFSLEPIDFQDISTHINGLTISQKKAATYEKLFKSESENIGYLFAAMNNYLLSDTLINNYRNSFTSDEDKLVLNNSSAKTYHGGIRVAHQLYETYNNSDYLNLAFNFAEKSKSNLLYQSISQHNAMQYGALPDSVVHFGEELKARINFYFSQINKSSLSGSKKRYYKDLLFNVKREYESYLSELEFEYPKYYQLKHASHFLTLPEIQHRLQNNVLLEYVLAEGAIYIFLVNNQNADILTLDRPEELESWIEKFRASIVGKDYVTYLETAHQLYKLLFEPVASYLEKDDQIIIVPDGNLWYLNFDLLLQEHVSGKPFQDLAYLIRDYSISYTNSANHFFINDDLSGIKDAPGKCLAFSYSNDASSTNSSIDFSVLRNLGDDLPGTRKEIRSISKLIPGKYYFGPLASESVFKEESKKYSILHLALHGEIDNKNPLYSKLHFSRNVKDTLNDGYLNTYEIYNMSFNAQMAVLSACNTGYGKLEKGEGLMSLGRAFQYAGVNSLLLTHWEVADEEAPEIMYNFYKYLKQGMGKSEALRQAKLEYLQTAGMFKSAPFYWGSFVVIGDTSPVEIESEGLGYWMYLLAVVALLAMAFIVYKRNVMS